MAQVFTWPDAPASWRRGAKVEVADPEPEVRLYVHHDELSRYIDDILDGKRPPVSVPRPRANGWPDDWRGWLLFVAYMSLAIWGIAKVLML